MKASHYQAAIQRTMRATPPQLTDDQAALLNWALGLAGEAGEVAELVKKHVFHGHALSKPALVKELGDVAFYLGALATQIEVSLGEVFQRNIEKLLVRYPHGFSAADSQARRDEGSKQ